MHSSIHKMSFLNNYLVCICITLICFPTMIHSLSQGQLVDKWAKRLGKELNDLGLLITKAQEIEDRYKFNNAQVQKKDPEKLLVEIVGGVTRMLNRKMDAIRCIVRAAEEASESIEQNVTEIFSYHSSKYSPVNGNDVELPESLQATKYRYEPIQFNIDSHFYNIAVNTSYSSVHVPTNLYDGSREAAHAIQWSEKLDKVFRKNYETDPALSWQYFGSSTGIMRHYPAMRWIVDGSEDAFDCRVRTWYIEAATCTKDIVILLDSSGSMLGMNKHIASLTVYTILKTLSNNDYVNILNYSVAVNYTVPCFKERLIQATPENIATFKMAVNSIDPQGKSDAEQGLIESFRLLEEYRKKRNCIENTQDCNQAIMLLTDGLTKNYTDLILKYNSVNDGTMKPVRIFTYLVGKEINKLAEIASLSCQNRGYYTLVSDLETVTEAVFKYINVIARPLILHRKYPISWTHTYVDTYTHDARNEHHGNQPYRLLTSAAIPAYNRSANISDDVHLLGIAGTDVTIHSIQQLTFPYKLGVNAHAFIVTNNGYVLMHPGLRPMFKNHPTPNYNSIDFTEVQQLDDDSKPRELAQTLLDLRAALIHGYGNVTRNVPLKYHYNNMQRVSRETFDFHYQKIKNTSFTMALALPNRFGYYAVQVPDEIDKNKHARVSILNFFSGSNWKIHPKWVYCRYHYLEGHEFDTPEQELLHFLARMYNKNFTWNQQYQYYDDNREDEGEVEEDEADTSPGIETVECNTRTKRLRQDDYYCDKELINMLVFDAKSTMQAFKEPWTFRNDREELLFKRYNASLRFVATMSGLTRWEYIFGEGNDTDSKMEFGDYNARAIDETWYKSAVLQHQYDIKSFVYSVPLYPRNIEDLLVTGSYAIFPKDASAEAPASVVGFQFSHSHLAASFFNIAVDNAQCDECVPCGDLLDCYIIDSSGYVVVSRDRNDTGIFFGEIQGCVLDSMQKLGFFDKLPIYDYQSLCYRTETRLPRGSRCNFGTEKMSSAIYAVFKWIIGKILLLFVELDLYRPWYPLQHTVMASSEDDDEIQPVTEMDDIKEDKNHTFFSCDHQKYLYILNQTLFITGKSPISTILAEKSGECPKKMYYAKIIPKSNLLLVAVKVRHSISDTKFTTKPERIVYENDTYHPCQKLELNDLTRRRLSGCFNTHKDEKYITACGYSRSTTIHHRVSKGDSISFVCLLQLYIIYARNLG